MIAVLTILFLLSYGCIVTVLLVRATKRMLELDEILQMFSDDISTNVNHFKALLSRPLFENSPEIVQANKNMRVMQLRLEEYANRFEELTGKKLISTSEKSR